MKECVLVAAPGGNPAPLVALTWALYRHWGTRVTEAHLVLYDNARHYVESELLGGSQPIEDLRRQLGDGEVAQVVQHVVTRPGGGTIANDQSFDDAALYMEQVWSVVRSLQRDREAPVLFVLVGGRRRTLTVNMATAFQLLGRPQDRLVDVRLSPKYADDPRWGFFFPEQTAESVIEMPWGEVVNADEVKVDLAEVRVPRLRRLLCEKDLGSFAQALDSGEEALEKGPIPRLVVDIDNLVVQFGNVSITLSYDQMAWYAAVVVQRLTTADGWLSTRDVTLLPKVVEACRLLWTLEPSDLSDGYDFDPNSDDQRQERIRPIRSRLRGKIRDALRGHPHKGLFVPESGNPDGPGPRSHVRVLVDPSFIELRPSWEKLRTQEGMR